MIFDAPGLSTLGAKSIPFPTRPLVLHAPRVLTRVAAAREAQISAHDCTCMHRNKGPAGFACTGSMDQRVSCAHRIKGPAGFVRTSDQWTSGLCACTAILHASPLLDRAADGVSHAQGTFLLRTHADPAAIMATAAAHPAAHSTQSCLSSRVSCLSSRVSSGPLCRH